MIETGSRFEEREFARAARMHSDRNDAVVHNERRNGSAIAVDGIVERPPVWIKIRAIAGCYPGNVAIDLAYSCLAKLGSHFADRSERIAVMRIHRVRHRAA